MQKSLTVNKIYWSYHIDVTKKRNRLKDYCGVFQCVPTEESSHTFKNITTNNPTTYYTYRWVVKEKSNFPYPMNHNITNRLTSDESIFETYEEAVVAHDAMIIRYAQHQNTKERATMLKKLINAPKPNLAQIEVDSVTWFNNLPEQEKKYVSWLKYYCADIKHY